MLGSLLSGANWRKFLLSELPDSASVMNFEASEPQIREQMSRKQQARKALQSAALNDEATKSN
ncbi:hypothetical protein [Pseudomonas brassicacearum]|uniref:hypothetical protein n=1 Tax=Pseudomonas brassicacearum TaxID=930166 RepID=UPI001D74E252|nr:hypothetical protein [Pseudomonas brassicacearum]CAH0284409.1 hypothetical protein SRABI06_04042 [Pseudomonas brassicacearum]